MAEKLLPEFLGVRDLTAKTEWPLSSHFSDLPLNEFSALNRRVKVFHSKLQSGSDVRYIDVSMRFHEHGFCGAVLE